MSKKNKTDLLREIRRVKLEIVMGDRNGHMMSKDYEKKLIKLEKELKDFKDD